MYARKAFMGQSSSSSDASIVITFDCLPCVVFPKDNSKVTPRSFGCHTNWSARILPRSVPLSPVWESSLKKASSLNSKTFWSGGVDRLCARYVRYLPSFRIFSNKSGVACFGFTLAWACSILTALMCFLTAGDAAGFPIPNVSNHCPLYLPLSLNIALIWPMMLSTEAAAKVLGHWQLLGRLCFIFCGHWSWWIFVFFSIFFYKLSNIQRTCRLQGFRFKFSGQFFLKFHLQCPLLPWIFSVFY